MRSAEPKHHTIDYLELAAPDVGQLKAFYGSAFGWTFNDYGPEYAGIVEGAGESGGIRLEPAPTPPLAILYSDDLDASVAAVQAGGGKVTEGPYEFPGGRRFHFTDPAGNHLAVWSAT